MVGGVSRSLRAVLRGSWPDWVRAFLMRKKLIAHFDIRTADSAIPRLRDYRPAYYSEVSILSLPGRKSSVI